MFKNFSSQTKILSYIYHKQEQDSPPPPNTQSSNCYNFYLHEIYYKNPDG